MRLVFWEIWNEVGKEFWVIESNGNLVERMGREDSETESRQWGETIPDWD
jgi:hypothetical protein